MRPVKSQTSEERRSSFGLVANGSAGSWDVALDETLTGPQRWFLQIDGPSCYLYLQVKHPRTIEETLDFLGRCLEAGDPRSTPSSAPRTELEISRYGGLTVTLILDHEAEQHCIVLIAGKNEFCSRIGLSQTDLQAIVSALHQVRDELFAEGVLAQAS